VITLGDGPSLSSAKNKADRTQTISFDFTPLGGHVKLGTFALDYPAGAVCDPDKSLYGPGEWKNDCVVLTKSIRVQAKFSEKNGRTMVDFSPNMRFAPDKAIMLSARVRELRGQFLSAELKALYAINLDQGSDDPTLATIFEVRPNGKATGHISRRVYHFSGYYVRSGGLCEEEDPDCV
jgi:hypothetical protein